MEWKNKEVILGLCLQKLQLSEQSQMGLGSKTLELKWYKGSCKYQKNLYFCRIWHSNILHSQNCPYVFKNNEVKINWVCRVHCMCQQACLCVPEINVCVPMFMWGNCCLLSGVWSSSLHKFTSPLFAENKKAILRTTISPVSLFCCFSFFHESWFFT